MEGIIRIMDLRCDPLSDGLILEHTSAQRLFQFIIPGGVFGIRTVAGWW